LGKGGYNSLRGKKRMGKGKTPLIRLPWEKERQRVNRGAKAGGMKREAKIKKKTIKPGPPKGPKENLAPREDGKWKRKHKNRGSRVQSGLAFVTISREGLDKWKRWYVKGGGGKTIEEKVRGEG